MNTTPPMCLRLTAQRWGTQPALRPGHMCDDGGVGEQPCLRGPVGAALPQEEPSELMISRTRRGGNAGHAEHSAPCGSREEPDVPREKQALGETGRPP